MMIGRKQTMKARQEVAPRPPDADRPAQQDEEQGAERDSQSHLLLGLQLPVAVRPSNRVDVTPCCTVGQLTSLGRPEAIQSAAATDCRRRSAVARAWHSACSAMIWPVVSSCTGAAELPARSPGMGNSSCSWSMRACPAVGSRR